MSVYVGIDVHRKRSQVAVINGEGEVLANRNVPNGVEPILGVIGGLPPGTPAAFEAAFGWGCPQQSSTGAAPDADVTARRLPGTGYPPQRTQAEAAESPGKATPGTRVEAAHCPPATLPQAAPPSGTVKQAGDITVLQPPDLRPGPPDHVTWPDRPPASIALAPRRPPAALAFARHEPDSAGPRRQFRGYPSPFAAGQSTA